MAELHVVTGAFGYTGKYIARLLLARGHRVMTLTGHPDRPNPFGDQVRALAFHFDRPDLLAESLRGVDTLYNTYWVRFAYGEVDYDLAVRNTKILFQAAREAGVKRVVHVSITNASSESPLPYFRGKGVLEEALRESGLSYAIIRPTVVFGPEDILINNIAWLLRRFPLFIVPGSGDYRLQPIFVEDLAELVVRAGEAGGENMEIDAVGPERFTFDELVALVARTVSSRAARVHLPPAVALAAARGISRLLGDVLLTRDEVDGLMADLLIADGPPPGKRRLSDWLRENAPGVGARYASEVARHYR
ncbi:MAG: SDR family oxidoreductase [Bacillota bacterium]